MTLGAEQDKAWFGTGTDRHSDCKDVTTPIHILALYM